MSADSELTTIDKSPSSKSESQISPRTCEVSKICKIFKGSGWEYMVHIEAPSTPECQEGVLSPGGHWTARGSHRVVQVELEHYPGKRTKS